MKSTNKQIKLHFDKGCDFRAKVKVDPSLGEAHRSLKEVVRMDIDVFSHQKMVIEHGHEKSSMLMINSGFSKREPAEAFTWTQIKVNISAYHHQHHQAPITYHVQLNFHHFHFVRHLRPDDNDHRVLLVRSVGDSLTNVGEALHPASRWRDFIMLYFFIFSYHHPASRWGIENQN